VITDSGRDTARAMLRIPGSQHAAMKMIVNQAVEAIGLHHTLRLGPILDGLMRNTPDALRFVEIAAGQGVQAAIERRDGPCRGATTAAPPPTSAPTRRTW